jgi:hypothetical protein
MARDLEGHPHAAGDNIVAAGVESARSLAFDRDDERLRVGLGDGDLVVESECQAERIEPRSEVRRGRRNPDTDVHGESIPAFGVADQNADGKQRVRRPSE